jgi:hypothetical protein
MFSIWSAHERSALVFVIIVERIILVIKRNASSTQRSDWAACRFGCVHDESTRLLSLPFFARTLVPRARTLRHRSEGRTRWGSVDPSFPPPARSSRALASRPANQASIGSKPFLRPDSGTRVETEGTRKHAQHETEFVRCCWLVLWAVERKRHCAAVLQGRWPVRAAFLPPVGAELSVRVAHAGSELVPSMHLTRAQTPCALRRREHAAAVSRRWSQHPAFIYYDSQPGSGAIPPPPRHRARGHRPTQ